MNADINYNTDSDIKKQKLNVAFKFMKGTTGSRTYSIKRLAHKIVSNEAYLLIDSKRLK